MPFRAVISSLCVALLLLSAAPVASAWAQGQDGTTTAKKKKTAPKKSGGSNGGSQSGDTPGDRGTGSY